MSEANIIVRVEDELKKAFSKAAKMADRTVSQLLRDFMRDFVKTQLEKAEYDAWVRSKVAEGMADVRCGRVKSSEEVEAYFAAKRAATLQKMSESSSEA